MLQYVLQFSSKSSPFCLLAIVYVIMYICVCFLCINDFLESMALHVRV